MSVQSRADLASDPFILSGEALARENETIKQDAVRTTALAPKTVMGRRKFVLPTTATPGTNTGNGTVNAISKLADGKNLIPGNYRLLCTAAGVNGRAAGAVTPGTNTGDGTVTAFGIVSGKIPKIGNYVLKCIDPNFNGEKTATATKTGTGTGTASAVTLGSKAIEGNYIATCINADVSGSEVFEVLTPNGAKLKNLTVGVPYVTDHFSITISAGGTDFIVDDYWTIAVMIAHGSKFTLTDPDSVIVNDSIVLPGTAGGSVTVSVDGITFILSDGTTDYAENDQFTLAVIAADGGTFSFSDPYGNIISSSMVLSGQKSGGTTFEAGGIKMTINDGTTDYAVNDSFTIAVTTDGDYVPLDPTDLLGGAEFAGIYTGDSIAAASIVAGDVTGCPMIVGGRFTIDATQLVFENGLTMSSVLPSGKTVAVEMQLAGIYAESTTDITEFEN